MKFTLLFFTVHWDTGPVVELNHIPPPGSVVWTAGRRSDEEGAMYYVDNVMYPEVGLDDGDAVYLYVRPYTGYSRYAPMTETDRLASKLAGIKESLWRLYTSAAAAAALHTHIGSTGILHNNTLK